MRRAYIEGRKRHVASQAGAIDQMCQSVLAVDLLQGDVSLESATTGLSPSQRPSVRTRFEPGDIRGADALPGLGEHRFVAHNSY